MFQFCNTSYLRPCSTTHKDIILGKLCAKNIILSQSEGLALGFKFKKVYLYKQKLQGPALSKSSLSACSSVYSIEVELSSTTPPVELSSRRYWWRVLFLVNLLESIPPTSIGLVAQQAEQWTRFLQPQTKTVVTLPICYL
jgi:hypothetical protein